MIVFVVLEQFDYIADGIHGVYATRDAAEAKVKAESKSHCNLDIRIEAHEVELTNG